MSAKKVKRPASQAPQFAAASSSKTAPDFPTDPLTPTAPEPSWMDSSDPRKRLWGKIIFAALWVYVAALCLLAIDQTFDLGIFGPKRPPIL